MDDEKKRAHRRRRARRPGGGGAHKASLPNLFFAGDPHGEFEYINRAVREHHPDAVIILGDCQPPRPMDELLGEAMSLTQVWWIPGNHDTDTDEFYDYLWRGPLGRHNLHGRVANVCGLKIAGLGGVFRGQIWMPDDEPNYKSAAQFIRRISPVNLWRDGLPRRHRSTIFPSVYRYLEAQKADILVTHEAPSCHANGFAAIDRLAEALGVRWMFHGHKHEDRVYGLHQGRQVRAVGFRGIVSLAGDVIVPAQMDPRETQVWQEAFNWANRTMPPGVPVIETPQAPIVWAPTHRGIDMPLDSGITESRVQENPRSRALADEVSEKTPVARFKPADYVVKSGRRKNRRPEEAPRDMPDEGEDGKRR